MNPRDFCREPGYTSSLLLTFQFDPLFFERVGLLDLIAGGTGDILVIADAKQIAQLSPQWEGQLRSLGRRYQLIPAITKSTFHPKLILRVGKQRGAIWISSGNLTFGGWGGNKELATAWEIGPGKQDNGSWVRSFLKQVQSWCAYDLQHDVIRRMLGTPWIRDSIQPTSRGTILISYNDRSLRDEIEKRWHGRHFEEVEIFTGSTDESGSVLEWLHKIFGIKKAVIILDEGRARFSPKKLSQLPLEVQVKHFPGNATMHAKFFWFAGETSSAAIFGSGNCSAAAWLIPPRLGGNIETINVYDTAQAADFEDILSIFQDESLPVAKLTEAQPIYKVTEDKTVQTLPVADVTFDNSTGEFRVKFIHNMSDLESLSIQVSDSIFMMIPLNGERSLWASKETGIEGSKFTLFVSLEFEFKAGSKKLQRRYWVNDIGELKHNSLGRHIQDTLGALSNPPQSPSEQGKILVQLHQIATSLLSEPESFPDSFRGLPRVGKEEDEKADSSKPVNPEELLRSLDEIKAESKTSNTGQITSSLSLIGIMRALFDFVESEDIEEERFSEDIEAEEENDDSSPEEPSTEQKKPGIEKSKEPDARYKKKLMAQIEDFFDKLGDPKFGEVATATQTVQASAFPLAVIFYGIRGGWVDGKLAQGWSMRIFDILFHQAYQGKITGLLNYVQKRYCEEGKQEEFARILGDGTLWLALLCCIATTSWKGQNAGFRKVFALRSILRAEGLIISTDSGQMTGLVTKVEESRIRPVFTQAPLADKLLEELENVLKRDKDELFFLQENAQYHFEVGDLLWMAPRNWAECLEASSLQSNFHAHLHVRAATRKVSGRHFLNVTKLATQREEISRSLARMEELSSFH